MASDKVLVYTTNKAYEAEMIKQFLFDNAIPAFIINKMDSSYLFGDIELLVERDHVIKAKKLIEDFHKNE